MLFCSDDIGASCKGSQKVMVSMETISEVKHSFYGSKALLTFFSITNLVGQQELRNANSQTY